MLTIKGYDLGEMIREGTRTLVYRAVRESDRRPVILKILRSPYPTSKETESLEYQYALLQTISGAEIIESYGLERVDNRSFLVLEDFGGNALRFVLKKDDGFEVEAFLELAIRLSRALDSVHANGIIHKDVKPDNIVVSPDGKIVKFVDFGISTRLNRENANTEQVKELEGTLAYISPEQTGRMNRALDYRTDFYSLGATLYELATGRRPFLANDPMEMIHCHIARAPEPPVSVNPEIPEAISAIILKLLAKNAEDRYQSSQGLIADLEICLKRYREHGSIQMFELAKEDFARQFQIPQRLYGRNEEIRTLLAAFEEARRGGRVALLVSGYSGIGKSSLINEINKPVVESRGIFVSGKYDQFKRNIPYRALTLGFQRFLRGILAESEATINKWRNRLLEKLGNNGQLIIDMIPEVGVITGPQPAVPQLAPAEAQNRFSMVLRNFVTAFADAEHPLVLFIDDLQWADVPTLQFVQNLLSDQDVNHVLLIGAYRDNEVDDSHPLMLTLAEVKKRGLVPGEIHLRPLALGDLTELVADTMRCSLDRAKPLSRLVEQKTLGNPFFVNQFLNALHLRGLVQLDHEQRRWDWDLERIVDTDITDNVVELMSERLRTYDEGVQNLLRLASCAGNRFYLHTLSIIAEERAHQVLRELEPALKDGLIYATGESAPSTLTKEDEEAPPENQAYQFLHDRVQQAAYALIDEAEHQEVHLKIGRLLLRHSTEDELDEDLFEITGQLNRGVALIDDQAERNRLAELNLKAGLKAKESTAYEPAIKHFRQTVDLLGGQPWQDYYETTFKTYRQWAESAYLQSNFAESDRLFSYILENAHVDLHRADIKNLRLVQYINTGRQLEGVAAGRMGLGLLDVPVPADENIAAALQEELSAIPVNLGKRKVAELIDEPELTDERKLMALTLLVNMWLCAYQVGNGDLANWSIARGMNLSLQGGNSQLACFVYVLYGMILGEGMRRYEDAYEWGRLGEQLMRKLDARAHFARVLLIYPCMVQCWSEPLENTITLFREAYTSGIDNGDLLYSGFVTVFLPRHQIANGDRLGDIYADIMQYQPFLERHEDPNVLGVFRAVRNAVQALRGETPEPFQLSTEDFDETEHVKVVMAPEAVLWRSWYLNAKLLVQYLGEDYSGGFENLQMGEAMPIRSVLFGHVQLVDYFYYGALVAAEYHDVAESEAKRRQSLEYLREYVRTFQEWRDKCYPHLFAPRAALLEAELARIEGDPEAGRLYDRAVDLSRAEELINCEAIANLQAGRYYLKQERPRIARGYLFDARYLFDRWGATAVAAQLSKKHGDLLGSFQVRSETQTISGNSLLTFSGTVLPSLSSSSSSSTTTSASLDLDAFVRASRTLSEEIQLDRLLQSMMEIVVQSAGASRGVLLLQKDDIITIEAEYVAADSSIDVLQSTPIDATDRIPANIIRYVFRAEKGVTGESLREDHLVEHDTYMQGNPPASLLCFPLFHQGKLNAVIYLENDIAAGAFTGERFEMLNLLSAQMAISLENALLYANLEQQVKVRTDQLIQAEKMASLGGLVAGVAHEISTPLGIGITAVSTLQDETLRFKDKVNKGEDSVAAAREYQETASDISGLLLTNLERAAELVQSFKQVAVDQASHERRSFKVIPYIEEIITSMRPRLQTHDHAVVVEGDREVSMISYPGPLWQVLTNLVSNTLNHAYPDARSGTSTIHVESRGATVYLTYSDDGVGIPEELLKRVFDPFFTTNRAAGGSGLGLHIVFNLVTQGLKGKLSLTSPPGSGAIFSMALPVQTD